MQLIFNPPENPENKYVQILVSYLRQNGHQVHPLESLLSSWKLFRQLDLIHLNWFENITDKSRLAAWKSFTKKIFVLNLIKISNKPLIWTMHNRMSHEKKTGLLSRWLVKKLITNSDAIIIHSKESEALLMAEDAAVKSKVHYIPHPDFVESYGPTLPTQPSNALKLLFVGVVKPYKNIELLMEAAKSFKGAVKLTVAGKPNSDAYKSKIEQLAAGIPEINLQLRFIEDKELPGLLAGADLLVLPYDLGSSLNSGTVLLAFSYQRSVICPWIGTLTDMEQMAAQFFPYTYKDSKSHFEALKMTIGKALEQHQQDAGKIYEMGKTMQAYVKAEHAQTTVAEQLEGIYLNLLTKNKEKDKVLRA
jgi:beta-1,4-mannosyltransferase